MTLDLSNFLPPSVPIDRSRAGVLRISVPLLGSLLRLPPDCEVAAVQVTLMRDAIELLIEGELMPLVSDTGAAAPVRVLLQKDIRGEGEEREECVTAWFEHAPERAWIFSNWAEPVP